MWLKLELRSGKFTPRCPRMVHMLLCFTRKNDKPCQSVIKRFNFFMTLHLGMISHAKAL